MSNEKNDEPKDKDKDEKAPTNKDGLPPPTGPGPGGPGGD
jgi:hypothetical protein